MKLWIPVAVWAGLIFFASSDGFSSESTGSFLHTVLGVEVPYWLHVGLRKLAHLVAYGILAALAWRADRRWAVVMAIVLAVAATDEMLQSRSLARTGSVVDVLIDLVGGAIVVTAVKAHRRTGS